MRGFYFKFVVMFKLIMYCIIFSCFRRFSDYHNDNEKYVSLNDEILKFIIVFIWSIPLALIILLIISIFN